MVQRILAVLLRFKLNQEYSELCGFVRLRVLLEIVWSKSLLLCSPQHKKAKICQRPELTDGVVMAQLTLWRV